MPPSAGHGSIGSTPRATKPQSCAVTPNGMTSRGVPRRAREAVARAFWIANTAPQGPTYVVLDAALQEEHMSVPLPLLDVRRSTSPASAGATLETIDRIRAMLGSGRRVVIWRGGPRAPWTPGRLASSSPSGSMRGRDRSQDRRHSRRITRCTSGAGDRSLRPPKRRSPFRGRSNSEPGLGGSGRHVAQAAKPAEGGADPRVARSRRAQWLEHGLPGPCARRSLCRRRSRCGGDRSRQSGRGLGCVKRLLRRANGVRPDPSSPLSVEHLAFALHARPLCNPQRLAASPSAVLERRVVAISAPAGFHWQRRRRGHRRRSGHLGGRRTRAQGQRPPADFDLWRWRFLMGVTALWTAVHYQIPLLLVIANNRCFHNDEVHQERVARMPSPSDREQVDRPAY